MNKNYSKTKLLSLCIIISIGINVGDRLKTVANTLMLDMQMVFYYLKILKVNWFLLVVLIGLLMVVFYTYIVLNTTLVKINTLQEE